MYKELRSHIIKLFASGTRLDGRKFTDYRPIKLETGVTRSAEGSARISIGETDIIVGIKTEVMEPFPDTQNEGGIMVGAELLPLSNPDFELGPPSIQAVEIARIVDRGIRESKSLDFKKLCIKEGEKVWMLIIDICTINDSGNLIDASALAAVAALKDMRFPKYEDEKVNYKEKTSRKLELEDLPITVTVIKIGEKLIVDPDLDEEKVIDARLSVASLSDGTLCALQKGGDYPLTPGEVEKMTEIALEKAKELRRLVK